MKIWIFLKFLGDGSYRILTNFGQTQVITDTYKSKSTVTTATEFGIPTFATYVHTKVDYENSGLADNQNRKVKNKKGRYVENFKAYNLLASIAIALIIALASNHLIKKWFTG